jgi:hypothetical protein
MRDARWRACSLVCVLSSVSASAAGVHADDWLAVWSACSERASSAPNLELVYPSERLPAICPAGDVLVARVRVPAALTPPPGVQQERALSGWSAELIGDGIVLGSVAVAHRHSLAVISVRPDAGFSLVYRVRLALPAYVAPGSYALWLRTPFGDRRAERAVAVTSPGVAPRMAAVPASGLQGRALASLPVDVWIAEPATLADTAPDVADLGFARQVRLALGAAALALRVGSELWVWDPCPSDRAAFGAELLDVLRSERRERVAFLPLTAAEIPTQELLGVSASGGAFDNRSSQLERQWTILLPAKASVRVSKGRLALYPAGDLLVRHLSGMAALLRVAAGELAHVELGPAAHSAPLRLEPEVAESGSETTLRVRGAASDARVAFDYGFARSAWTGPTLHTRFSGPLEQPLRAMVLTPAAGAQLVRGRISVNPQRPPSCAAELAHGGPGAAFPPLFALGFLLKRRRRTGFGNRVPAAPRCQLRDLASHAQKTI